jgi:hypothetical protein
METFVGLDVSLKEISVCILNQKEALVFSGGTPAAYSDAVCLLHASQSSEAPAANRSG